MTELFGGRLPRAVLGLVMAWAGTHAGRAQEDTAQAIDRLRQEIAANPQRLDLVLALGNTAAGAGKLDMAIASFQKVLENLEPDSQGAGEVHLRIGETYRRKGDPKAAIASLTRASELLPDQPVVLGTLALVLDGCGKKEEAERAYRDTLQLDPDNAIAMNNLAFLLAERGEDLDHALGFARRAAELMPEDADMIDTAGWVQMKRKQTDAALGLFAKAWGKAPGNEGYRQHLLLALAGKAERSAAMDELKGLLADESSAANLQKITDLLKSVERGATR
jgi:tetratricopeptide (TPR) repeat protein